MARLVGGQHNDRVGNVFRLCGNPPGQRHVAFREERRNVRQLLIPPPGIFGQICPGRARGDGIDADIGGSGLGGVDARQALDAGLGRAIGAAALDGDDAGRMTISISGGNVPDFEQELRISEDDRVTVINEGPDSLNMKIDRDKVNVTMDRGDQMSTLAVDIEIPLQKGKKAA